MVPHLADNDTCQPDLIRWLATVRSFASDWPRGVLNGEPGHLHTSEGFSPVDVVSLSHGGDND